MFLIRKRAADDESGVRTTRSKHRPKEEEGPHVVVRNTETQPSRKTILVVCSSRNG